MLCRRTLLCLTIFLGSSFIAATTIITAPPAERKETRFLENLTPGQTVSLSEKDGGYEIGVFPPAYQPLGQKVIEVSQNYVVFRDLAGITDTIVPIYSIKAIRILRVGGK